jgi:transcriptional regulator with XRE-family HTH domain
MTWLAERLGVQRTYLSAVASGARPTPPHLLARIDAVLAGRPAGEARLERVQEYAYRRAVFLDIRDRLAGAILAHDEIHISPPQAEELADELARMAIRTMAADLASVSEA